MVAFLGLKIITNAVTLSSVDHLHQKYFFTTFTLPREKKTPELLLDALLHYSKTTVQQMNFCGVSENAVSCTSLP